MSAYDQCFAIVVGEEGGFSNDRNDPGNWTGGSVGSGKLCGTMFGRAAESYAADVARLPADLRAGFPPVESLAELTLAQAKTIYQFDEWARIRGDDLPPALALLAFDAAVNNGDGRAERWLQTVAGAAVDGVVGNQTIAAVTAMAAKIGGAQLCANFLAQRLAFMSLLPTWRLYGANPTTGLPEGWAKRLAMLPYLSTTITA